MKNPEAGFNCENFAYDVTMKRGFLVDDKLRSSEFAQDRRFTQKVEDADIQTGDILGLCEKGKKDLFGIHMAIAVVIDNELYVLHNARHKKHVVLEPIEEAQSFWKHEMIAWALRPIEPAPALSDHEFLKDHGLGFLIPTA